MKEFIKTKLQESLVFEVINTIIDEEYPISFDMDKFKSLTKFSQRIAYCEANLKRISSGSSRIVYMIDNEKVLKLAKNQKGLAQNSTEIDWGNDYYFEYILAHTIDSSDKDLWVEMELAKKVTKENAALIRRPCGVPCVSRQSGRLPPRVTSFGARNSRDGLMIF